MNELEEKTKYTSNVEVKTSSVEYTNSYLKERLEELEEHRLTIEMRERQRRFNKLACGINS